jgi:quercetin dioxygenase-like cupin family protein
MPLRRDLLLCAAASGATLLLAAGVSSQSQSQAMSSRIVDWTSIQPRATSVGEVRDFFRSRTATLDELELHVTTLRPGLASHTPHQHPNEEVVILKEGTLEVFSNGETRTVGPGSVLFFASNQFHGVKNVGTTNATYHVINWRSPAPAE